MSGLRFKEADWPHGCRCVECGRTFVDGDLYTERLEAMVGDVPVAHLVCRPCSFREAAQA